MKGGVRQRPLSRPTVMTSLHTTRTTTQTRDVTINNNNIRTMVVCLGYLTCHKTPCLYTTVVAMAVATTVAAPLVISIPQHRIISHSSTRFTVQQRPAVQAVMVTQCHHQTCGQTPRQQVAILQQGIVIRLTPHPLPRPPLIWTLHLTVQFLLIISHLPPIPWISAHQIANIHPATNPCHILPDSITIPCWPTLATHHRHTLS